MKSSHELQSIFGLPENIPELVRLLSQVEVSSECCIERCFGLANSTLILGP